MFEINIDDELIKDYPDMYHLWMTDIKNILEKKYYHSLGNVNILLKSNTQSFQECQAFDDFFKILEDCVTLLKYQFKEFNIGFDQVLKEGQRAMFHIVKWNKKIDSKFSDQIKQEISNRTSQDDALYNKMKRQFYFLKQQWVEESVIQYLHASHWRLFTV